MCLVFLHISVKQETLTQAKFRHALWTIFARFSPKQEKIFAHLAHLAQAKVALELKCSLNHFCSSEKLFVQARKDFCSSKGIFAQARAILVQAIFFFGFLF